MLFDDGEGKERDGPHSRQTVAKYRKGDGRLTGFFWGGATTEREMDRTEGVSQQRQLLLYIRPAGVAAAAAAPRNSLRNTGQ